MCYLQDQVADCLTVVEGLGICEGDGVVEKVEKRFPLVCTSTFR
jgi:hypothetical protein